MSVHRTYLTASFIIFLVFLSGPAAAQTGFNIGDEDRAEFARHRVALFNKMGDAVAVVFGAYERPDNLRWRQNNRFYYLTGVEIPFATLILDGRNDSAILFLPPGRNGTRAIYEGETLGPGPEAAAYFGIADVRPIAEFEPVLRSLVSEGQSLLTVLQPEEIIAGGTDAALAARGRAAEYPWAAVQSREQQISTWLNSLFSSTSPGDLTPMIDDLRRVKTPWEIKRMREACRIAGEGHVAAMQATRKGAMEHEIQAAAEERFIANGAFFEGYAAIVGAGRNNNILHYRESYDSAKRRDLILMDFGPDYRYYSADITRTWPVKGTFSERQRAVYRDVLDVQKKLIKAVRPDLTFEELRQLNNKYFAEKGYTREQTIHGPSHYVGMAVHDVGDSDKPFEPGVVITIEPGVYLPEEGFGIRIEDVVLVTADGAEVLSSMIPKEDYEIEAVVQGTLDPFAQKNRKSGFAGSGWFPPAVH